MDICLNLFSQMKGRRFGYALSRVSDIIQNKSYYLKVDPKSQVTDKANSNYLTPPLEMLFVATIGKTPMILIK